MILLELVIGVQLYSHPPNIVIDATFTEAEGMVIVLHVVEVDTTQMTSIDCCVTPEQHASALFIPLLDEWCGSLHVGRDVPYVAFAYTLKVAPELVETVRARVSELTATFPTIETFDVVEDPRLKGSACVLETEAGVADASVESQLAAIERSLKKHIAKEH